MVYNELGKEVRTLVDQDESFGIHTLDAVGFDLKPGVYTYRLVLQGIIRTYSATKSMIVVRK